MGGESQKRWNASCVYFTHRNYSAGFKVKDMLKDLRLVHEEFLDREILPGVNLAQKLFELVITTFPQDQGGLMGTQSMVLAYKNGLQNELK